MKKGRLNNEAPTSKAMYIKCGAKGTVKDGLAKLSFQGYGGNSVNLSDYGFDYPVVYNIATMSTRQKIPILYNHHIAIGHTTSVRKVDNQSAVRGKGVTSVPGPDTDRVVQGLDNGFPFEASAGLDANWEDLSFIANGEVTVNNQTFKAPIYVWDNTAVREMTVTEFGRDDDTSFELLNEERRMRIKNQAPKGKSSETAPKETNTDPKPPAETKVDNKTPEPKTPEAPKPKEDPKPTKVDNSTPGETTSSVDQVMLRRALVLNSRYPKNVDDVLSGIERGWDDESIENSIKLKNMNADLPKPPKPPTDKTKLQNSLACRVGLSFGSSPEFLEKKFGKETTETAYDQGQMGITELLLTVANSQGGNFTGHSDIEQMCKFIKNAGYSTWDLPDFFEKVGSTLKEERWELNTPFAPGVCKEGSNKDFRTTERRRVTGGDMWTQVAGDGKVDMFSMSGQKKYQTNLETYGSLFTLTREEVINDDQGALNDMMDAMVEGAMMIPDYQLGQLMLAQAAAADTFWVNSDNSFTSKALTRANLSERYKAIRRYNENKENFSWNVMLNDKWNLIVGPDLEEEAWELVKQDKIVQETGAANGTKTGDKNYWFGRLNIMVFPQMGNTSAFGSSTFVSQGTWLLWPSSVRFAPYEITYLRGQKTPVVESVDLPATMLGFGTRGYWDVKINERERTAICRNNG